MREEVRMGGGEDWKRWGGEEVRMVGAWLPDSTRFVTSSSLPIFLSSSLPIFLSSSLHLSSSLPLSSVPACFVARRVMEFFEDIVNRFFEFHFVGNECIVFIHISCETVPHHL